MIISGRTLVATPGKIVPLSITSQPTTRVTVFALGTNSGEIAIGDKTISAVSGKETGMPLEAKDAITYDNEDLSKIYIDAEVAGNGVRWDAVL